MPGYSSMKVRWSARSLDDTFTKVLQSITNLRFVHKRSSDMVSFSRMTAAVKGCNCEYRTVTRD